MNGGYWKVILVAAAAGLLGGCDCKDRIQNLFYGSDRDRSVSQGVTEDGEPTSRMREVEPNDTADQATSIPLRSELRPMYGAIDPAEDVDWFKLDVKDGEDWLVELTVEPEDEDLDIAIYLEIPGSGDEAPLLYDVAGPGEAEQIPMLGVPADQGRRFFVTGVDGGTGEYRIDVRRRLSAASVAVAPNDYPHLAQHLELPGEIQGFYDRPHDRDIFFVPAEYLQAGVYSLELSAIPDLPQTLRIYGDQDLETRLMEISVSGREPAVIPNLSLGADAGGGLYFVLTAGEGYDRDRGYRLRVIEHPPAGDYVLEREPNDSAGTAQRINLGDRVRGYIHTPNDVDRFRFVIGQPRREGDEESDEQTRQEEERRRLADELDPLVESDEEPGDEPSIIDPWEMVPEKDPHSYVVQARLRPLGEAHRFGLRWIPDEGSGLRPRRLEADNAEQELVICNKVVDDGEFHIEVSSLETTEAFRPRTFDYELELINVAEMPGIEVEPNDTPEQADRLPMGERRSGFIATEGDVDVYAFIVGPDEPVEIGVDESDDEADGEPSRPSAPVASLGWEAPETENVRVHLEANRLNLGFEILDDEGGRVAHVNRAGPGSDEVLNIDLPHGLYYVAVRASSGSLCEPYHLEVTTQ